MRVLINPYLNAAPLWWPLRAAPPPGWRIAEAVPAAAVRALENGECELALISAVALLSLDGVKALRGWGVAAAGPVETVVLAHKRPLAELRTIGVDAASRSAQALLKVLCARRWKITPQFVPVEEPEVALLELDAVMAIGDKSFSLGRGLPRRDLAQEWHDWTGLPFLFAAWAAREPVTSAATAELLNAAGESGQRQLDEIATAFARTLYQPAAKLADYLRSRVYHRLGDNDWAGLQRFAEEARAACVIPEPRAIMFFG